MNRQTRAVLRLGPTIAPRAWCATCRRARSMCWCDALRPFPIAFELAILMHPKEARVAVGTGRMVHLAVDGSRLFVGNGFSDHPALGALLARRDLAPAVLFPGPRALDLTFAPPEAARAIFPRGRRPLLLVADGTWTTAKKVLRLTPALATLPAVAFTPPHAARYGRLRKEPRPHCWSTLEAVHHIIERLDALGIAPAPGRAHDHLLELLDRVIERQLAFEPNAS